MMHTKKKPKQIRAVFFDMDGTLIDSELLAADVVRNFYASFNYQLSQEDEHAIIGKTWNRALEILQPKYPIQYDTADILDTMIQNYRKALKQKVIPIPGVIQAVRAISQQIPLAVVSGSVRSHIEFVLEKMQIQENFKFILGMEDYLHSKPAPDSYLKAIELMQIEPEEGVVFEDSMPGIMAARSAGLWVIAISAANHFFHDQSMAHAKVHDYTDINIEKIAKLLQLS